MRIRNIALTLLFALCAVLDAATPDQVSVDLSGKWSFQLDDSHVGQQERWFEKNLKDDIHLPGSTDEAGFGIGPLLDVDTIRRRVEAVLRGEEEAA